MIRLTRGLSKKPQSGFKRGVAPPMAHQRQKREKINFDVLPRKPRQALVKAEQHAKRLVFGRNWPNSNRTYVDYLFLRIYPTNNIYMFH